MTWLLHEAMIFPVGGICITCGLIKGSEPLRAAAHRYISDLHPMMAMAKDGDAARIYGARGSPVVPTGIPGVENDMERMGIGTPQGRTGIAGRRVGGVQARLPA